MRASTDLSLGLIVVTDPTCKIRGHVWPGIPTLLWPEGIDEPVSDWLRALVVEYGVAASTAKEYAKILRPFRRFCRHRKRPWNSVDDNLLLVWREHLLRSEAISASRAKTSLEIIFAFYRWAEEKKYLRYHVGIYSADEIPEPLKAAGFPISAKQRFTKGKNGRVYGGWTTPLSLSTLNVKPAFRHTPEENEVRNLHEVALSRVQGERDSLIFSWAEETGARRAEILSIGKSQLPTPNILAALIEKDEPWIIHIRRKGGSVKPINVPIDLIIRTQEFVDFRRSDIVKDCRKKIVGYCEPDEIFLSGRTGQVLHPDSVTSIGRRAFRQADIARANVHRLRASFAVRTIETLVDSLFDGRFIGSESSWVETILFKACEIMGQADPRSLRPYLTYVLNRRIQTSEATKSNKLAARLRQLWIQEEVLVQRLTKQRDLQQVAGHIKAGRVAEAIRDLRALADSLAGT